MTKSLAILLLAALVGLLSAQSGNNFIYGRWQAGPVALDLRPNGNQLAGGITGDGRNVRILYGELDGLTVTLRLADEEGRICTATGEIQAESQFFVLVLRSDGECGHWRFLRKRGGK